MNIMQKTFVAKADSDDPLSYVMSDGTVDRMGDVIEPDGWKLGNFKKNPIALFAHDSRFIVGNWGNFRVEKNALRGELDLLEPVSDRLIEINTAVKAGVLRAVSVGFRPIKQEAIEGSKVGGVRFIEQELVECSLVAVPANPNAIQFAKSLNLSPDAMSMIFGKTAEQKDIVEEIEYTKLTSIDEWSPYRARQAKQWLAGLVKDYPFNPLYAKLHRLMDEIETVQTISLVSAKAGTKSQAQ
jgi:HK97 family phage prohead protease